MAFHIHVPRLSGSSGTPVNPFTILSLFPGISFLTSTHFHDRQHFDFVFDLKIQTLLLIDSASSAVLSCQTIVTRENARCSRSAAAT